MGMGRSIFHTHDMKFIKKNKKQLVSYSSVTYLNNRYAHYFVQFLAQIWNSVWIMLVWLLSSVINISILYTLV